MDNVFAGESLHVRDSRNGLARVRPSAFPAVTTVHLPVGGQRQEQRPHQRCGHFNHFSIAESIDVMNQLDAPGRLRHVILRPSVTLKSNRDWFSKFYKTNGQLRISRGCTNGPETDTIHDVSITVESLTSKMGKVFWFHLYVWVAYLHRVNGSLCSGRTMWGGPSQGRTKPDLPEQAAFHPVSR